MQHCFVVTFDYQNSQSGIQISNELIFLVVEVVQGQFPVTSETCSLLESAFKGF